MKRISADGLILVKEFEGLYLTAYLCPAGVPTIGYGHTKGVTHEDVANDRTITRSQAEDLLHGDMAEACADVERLVKVPISDAQFGALASFQFNTGALGKSTLLKKLNARDYAGAAAEFARWNKATVKGQKVVLAGLIRRRAAEAALFLNGERLRLARMPQAVEPTGPKPLAESKTMQGGVLAGAAAAVVGAVQAVSPVFDQAKAVSEALDLSPWVVAAILAAGLAWALWRKVQDNKEASA